MRSVGRRLPLRPKWRTQALPKMSPALRSRRQVSRSQHRPGRRPGRCLLPAAGSGEQSQDEPLVSGDDDEGPPAAQVTAAAPPPTRLRTTSKQIGKVPLLNAAAGGRAGQADRGRAVRRGEAPRRRSRSLYADARIDLEQVAEDGRRAPRTTCSRPTCVWSSRGWGAGGGRIGGGGRGGAGWSWRTAERSSGEWGVSGGGEAVGSDGTRGQRRGFVWRGS